MEVEILRRRTDLRTAGSNVDLSLPSALKLQNTKGEKQGYMMCFTHDLTVVNKMIDQLTFLCEFCKIPSDAKFNAGFGIKLQVEKILLTRVAECVSMDCVANVYRATHK
jgi:hypothetical protein